MVYIQFLINFPNIIFIFKNWGELVIYYKINIKKWLLQYYYYYNHHIIIK
jgi:hypothetical protein